MTNPASVRPIALLLATSLPLAAQAAGDAAPRARESAVLALLRRIPTDQTQIHATKVEVADSVVGSPIVVPAIRGLCGTGWQPAFDPALARTLARELFAIYGLDGKASAPAPHGVAAELDCFDAARGIGIELRGTVENQPIGGGGEWPTVVDEPAATGLEFDEFDALEAAKVRMHVADVRSFWTAASSDRLTTTLCYLASVAAFLNTVTDGEDVDLLPMLGHPGTPLAFATPKPQAGLRVENWSGGATLTAERAIELTLPIDTKNALPNDGKPATIVLRLQCEQGAFTLSLQQTDKSGKPQRLATSTSAVLLVPGAFDRARPFALVLSLQPGSYRLQEGGWLSGSSAPKK